jgi:hypothetical protein
MKHPQKLAKKVPDDWNVLRSAKPLEDPPKARCIKQLSLGMRAKLAGKKKGVLFDAKTGPLSIGGFIRLPEAYGLEVI